MPYAVVSCDGRLGQQRSRGARDDVQQVDASKWVCVRRTFLDLNLNFIYIYIYDSSSRESPFSGHVTQPITSILAPTPRYAARFPFSKSSSCPPKSMEAPRAYPVAPLLYQVPFILPPASSPSFQPPPTAARNLECMCKPLLPLIR